MNIKYPFSILDSIWTFSSNSRKSLSHLFIFMFFCVFMSWGGLESSQSVLEGVNGGENLWLGLTRFVNIDFFAKNQK